MVTVQSLKQKAFSVNYVYLKVLQKYRFDADEMHYVFEGYEDQSFYFNYLQGNKASYVTHVSLGKNQSVDLYNKLDWTKYDKKRILIFIDRDYSRILGDDVPSDLNIYETTFYSIENYVVDKGIFRRLINEILHYHEETVIEYLLEIYEKEYSNFFIYLKPILLWVLVVRDAKLKANLNQIDLSKLFFIDENLNLQRRKLERVGYLEKVTQVRTPSVSLSEVKRWYEVINSQVSNKLVLRGKYDIWFFITFFSKANEFLKRKYAHDPKMKTNLTISNALEIIGPRTGIPKRLHDFLTNLQKSVA